MALLVETPVIPLKEVMPPSTQPAPANTPHEESHHGACCREEASEPVPSHIVRDKVTGATYMDTVTTLVGWVTLSAPGLETLAQGPTIQEVMDLI